MCAAHLPIFPQQKNTMSATTKEPIVTVSIVNFHTADLLARCIHSVLRHVPHLARIIIVNHSNDNITLPKSTVPIDVITQPNRGFGAGHNAALRTLSQYSCATHYHLFLNPDAYFTSDIAPLLAHFTDASVAVVAPRITDATGQTDPYCAGAFPTLLSTLRNKIIPPRLPQKCVRVDWVSGCAMLVRTEDFLAVGSFDENYFLYFEDVDLCTRMTAHHKAVLFDPSVHAVHDSGKSFTDSAAQKKHYDASQQRFFATYHSALHTTAQKILRWFWRKIR